MSYEDAARLVLAQMKVEATEDQRWAEAKKDSEPERAVRQHVFARGMEAALKRFERRVSEEIRKES